MNLTMPSTRRALGVAEKRQLANALGDSPETALSVHLLRTGHGLVRMIGDLPDFRAVVIEEYDVGPELLAFGHDAPALWHLLQEWQSWDIVNVSPDIAGELAEIIRREAHTPSHLVDDIYQVPGGPVAVVPNPDVRLLTVADCGMLDATPDDIRDSFDDDLEMVLREELVAGAVVDGKVVAVGCTYGLAEQFVDVAVSTLGDYRCRGYARAAASLVAAGTQQLGHTPIWSCAPANTASLAVAASLGFRESSRRVNIVLEKF